MFNRNNFEIAKLLPSDTDDIQIQGLYLTPEATYMAAYGFVVRVTTPEVEPGLFPVTEGIEPADYFSPFMIDRDTALQVAKNIPKKGDPSDLIVAVDCSTEADSRATLACSQFIRDSVTRSRKLGGIEPKFPDIEKIITPVDAAQFTIAFSVDFLHALLAQFAAFCKYHDSGEIVLRFTGPRNMVRMDSKGVGQTMTAVLMPRRMVETESDTESEG